MYPFNGSFTTYSNPTVLIHLENVHWVYILSLNNFKSPFYLLLLTYLLFCCRNYSVLMLFLKCCVINSVYYCKIIDIYKDKRWILIYKYFFLFFPLLSTDKSVCQVEDVCFKDTCFVYIVINYSFNTKTEYFLFPVIIQIKKLP